MPRRARSRPRASTSSSSTSPRSTSTSTKSATGACGPSSARRRALMRDRRPHLLRLRDQGEHRLEDDARRRMAAIRADVPAPRALVDRQVSLECANSHVPIELIGLLEGKDVLVGAIDVPPTASRRPEDVAATIRVGPALRAGRAALSVHELRMVPLAREVARGKLRALAAGAALVRAEARAPRRAQSPFSPGRTAPRPRKIPLSIPKKPLAPGDLGVYPPQSVLVSRSKYALYDRFAVVPPSFFP